MDIINKLKYIEYNHLRSSSISKIFHSCPFCNNPIDTPLAKKDINSSYFNTGIEIKVYECKICGWWQVDAAEHWVSSSPAMVTGVNAVHLKSKLKSMGSLSNEPLKILSEALNNKSETIRNMSPTRFELFVSDVLKDFFDCEVRHVGQTNDGGIDLLMIQSDTIKAVQVKRRGINRNSESVSTVRDFLGGMILKDLSSGYVVSTANKFSKAAQNSAAVASAKGYRIKLIAVDTFNEMLKCLHNSKWSPIAIAAAKSNIKIGSLGTTRVISLIDFLKEVAPERFGDFKIKSG